jgi:hypothetical protein
MNAGLEASKGLFQDIFCDGLSNYEFVFGEMFVKFNANGSIQECPTILMQIRIILIYALKTTGSVLETLALIMYFRRVTFIY